MTDDWRKSKLSFANGNCVEVASGGQVRDSKDRIGTVLTVGPDAWRRFVAEIKEVARDSHMAG